LVRAILGSRWHNGIRIYAYAPVAIPEDLFRRTAAAAYELHRHRDATTWPSCLTRALSQAVTCDSAVLVTVDLERRDFRLDTSPPGHFEHLDRDDVVRLHAADHPFVARCATSRSIGAFRLGDLAPREQFLKTALYRNLYRFLGIEHQLVMLVASADANWRAVALNRSGADFAQEERFALEALWPHIMLAQRHLRRSRAGAAAAFAPPAAKGSGVVVLDSLGAVAMCSEPARLWLAEYFDIVFLAGGVTLPPTVGHWVEERIGGERQGRRLRVVRRDPLIVTRGERSLVIDLIVDHGRDLHLMTLEEVALNAPAASLEALGLTARESEVLMWVAQGKTNREVGIILGASPRTIQKHLEHMFQKLGVETRTAAILRAWQAGRHAALG
jgi:DNA-binding CsgD family transcriptional regulator